MIIAVDTGGTKTLIARFDNRGEPEVITKFPTPRDQQDYITSVTTAIKEASGTEPVDALIVALPGPIRHGVLQRSPNIGWQGFDVVTALKQHFPDTLVAIGNDADLGGIAEARVLSNPGLCIYVTLSTGVGTGITSDGNLIPQLERFEGGSMRIEYNGERMRWEDVASGKSFYERYSQYGSDVEDPEKWKDFAERAASGLMALIPLVEPNHVVIGGSMGTHYVKYGSYLQAMLDESIAKHMTDVTISQAKHPEQAVIYGCYYYAVDQLSH